MANYECTVRTNYFRVTDEERYQELFGSLYSGCDIEDFTKTAEDGTLYHGFGAYDCIGVDGEDLDDFYEEIQKILPEDEAFILVEAGHEKLRYVVGYVIVVTKKGGIVYKSLDDVALEVARQTLGSGFTTVLEY